VPNNLFLVSGDIHEDQCMLGRRIIVSLWTASYAVNDSKAVDGWGCKSRSTKHSPPYMHVFAGVWLCWPAYYTFSCYRVTKLLGNSGGTAWSGHLSYMSVKQGKGSLAVCPRGYTLGTFLLYYFTFIGGVSPNRLRFFWQESSE
jgi:hypothetical protein